MEKFSFLKSSEFLTHDTMHKFTKNIRVARQCWGGVWYQNGLMEVRAHYVDADRVSIFVPFCVSRSFGAMLNIYTRHAPLSPTARLARSELLLPTECLFRKL